MGRVPWDAAFGHDMTIMMISSQQTWLPAEDLCEIKSLSDSIMRGGENQKFPPFDEALLTIDGG